MTVGGEKHAPDRGHVLNNGWNTSHTQKHMIDCDQWRRSTQCNMPTTCLRWQASM